MPSLTPHQKAALEYKHHISLTANAGSGKTFVLSKRYVEIALQEDISLTNIVAITFTEKAASELYKKITGEVEARLMEETNPTNRKRLERIRRQLVSANISTIHSFCIDVLKDFSPEAGIDANFLPIDPNTSNELIEVAIEEIFGEVFSGEDEDSSVKYLVRLFGSRGSLIKQLTQLIEKRKTIDTLNEKFYSCGEEEIATNFHEIFLSEIISIFGDRLTKIFADLSFINEIVLSAGSNDIALEIGQLLKRIENENDLFEKLIFLNEIKALLLTTKGEVKQRGYLKKKEMEANQEIVDEINKFFTDYSDFQVSNNSRRAEVELARFGKRLIELYEKVTERYDSQKEAKGYLDFEDLLIHTKNVLENEFVRKALSEKYQYVMIDEFQDTNEIQYEIFLPILNRLNTGNLFVVGDEKQSIYMFRDADLEIFERTKNEIKEKVSDKGILQLPHSFRVSPKIALFTNKLFSKLFANPQVKYNEVQNSELYCARSDYETGSIEILYNNLADGVGESRLITNKILRLIKDNTNGIAPGDIAILTRKRSGFKDLEEALSEFNIPYSIVGGKGFYQRQLVYDINSYIKFLLNTDDEAALIGILRSPFYNLSDDDIYYIHLEKGKTFRDKLQSFVEREEKYLFVGELLKKHIKLATRVEPIYLLRTLLNDTNYWASIASKSSASQELANLDKLLQITDSFAGQSFNSLFDFEKFLSEAIDDMEDEGQAILEGENSTVKIMTLHQSKGLEFNTVFLYGCNDIPMDDKVKSRTVNIDKNFGILTKVPVDDTYFEAYEAAPIIGAFNYTMKRKSEGEAKRLLYVGITRAVDNLYITASHKDGAVKANSFIHMLQDSLMFDNRSNGFTLSDNLTCMRKVENDFEFYQAPVSVSVKISDNDYCEEITPLEKEKLTEDNNEISLINITDLPESEIVSATKIAVFKQCPRKYHLTYDLGYAKLLRRFREEKSGYEFQAREEDEGVLTGDVKGRIVHKLLEEETTGEILKQRIDSLIRFEENVSEKDWKNETEKIYDEIISFYNSSQFKEIDSFANFRNEFELYTVCGDYYLYGIIDKLIIDGERAIVVDYKTDRIDQKKIKNKIDNYLPQLKFYAYLVSCNMRFINEFVIRLVFIDSSEDSYSTVFIREDLAEFEKELHYIIQCMREETYPVNETHCRSCHFGNEAGVCVMNNNLEK